jgi:transcriptional regulator with XRE-family HTH domain
MKNTKITDEKMQQIYQKIGENVKKEREKKGMSQLHLALAIGHNSVSTISMAERCLQNKHFNIEHLIKIADVLEVDVCRFFE